MKYYEDHRKLFGTAIALFLGLTYFVAIAPALRNEAINEPLPGSEPLSSDEQAGKELYIANGCVACHTQQVRDIPMDASWGSRPSIAADYARSQRTDLWRNTATLMGTERTGPDLTDVGTRQPSVDWHLLHLYNPRAVVPESVMPAYPWMFQNTDMPAEGQKVVPVPDSYRRGSGKIVATEEALQLVAYLLSLKQVPLPDGSLTEAFAPEPTPLPASSASDGEASSTPQFDGARSYQKHCQACHQPTGKGLAGAFPPLAGSPIVLEEDPSKIVSIVMNGYDGRVSEGYAVMPPIGTTNNISPEELQAIVNYIRSSWGNDAPAAEIDQIRTALAE
ncbi:cbb3-type cytochrome c oxidase subunit II [Pelagicoccus sp. SDUM812005]|uniref:cytochrome c n=1 Tax=Pelagicoccus sp. SDUM812005 TaxID=3041257 RepID=UPI00280F6B60|nr:cbb3-type cytochrome c oxidase subunit II [Pelagicoccus sp. SDUM812005]MDQ8182259.1 cbb3-type cytochrome c oxidase subunit II [Pelagicoccus sp. SDUM812005]